VGIRAQRSYARLRGQRPRLRLPRRLRLDERQHHAAKPTRHYRQLNITLGGQQQYNFDGDVNDGQIHGGVWTQLANWWNLNTFTIYRPAVFDERLTRGGPVVRRAGNWFTFASVGTDSRKDVVVNTNANYGWTDEGAWSTGIGFNVRLKPASTLAVSFGPGFNRSGSNIQYVRGFGDPTATHFHGQRVVFADLVQHSVSRSSARRARSTSACSTARSCASASAPMARASTSWTRTAIRARPTSRSTIPTSTSARSAATRCCAGSTGRARPCSCIRLVNATYWLGR
jgi:hypothetical protein